ncbi:toxin co-regulated pilus biosynthesis Q family protein [Gluconobacter sp. OJB]|uniref:toxin co-regulated pilus biosynthesis Q family protein n=1 Tax=Gluconobacter sp. OJB TaxID=3145196 RepID=UPI0031F7A8DD
MTRRPYALTAASLLAFLSACAEVPPSQTSHISGAGFRDTSALTVFIADILAHSLDAGRTVLRLAPYTGPDDAHAQTLLTDTLRERGFALSPQGMPYPGAQTVRYAVSPLGADLLVELDVEDAVATCLYGHDSTGALRRKGSCSLRSGASLTLRIPEQDVLVSGPPAPEKPQQTRPSGPVQLAPQSPVIQPHPDAVVAKPLPALAPVVPEHPALVKLQPPAEVWTLVEGQPIRDQMMAWADRAGWKISWPASLNWMVPAMTTFNGDFKTVMSSVIQTVSDEGKSIRAEFHTPNRYLVVTSPGGGR